MVHSIRTGFDPTFVTQPVPGHRPNHAPVYDEFAATAKHMDEVDDFLGDVYTAPSFNKPYLSSPLLTVVREKHRLKALRDGTVAKGRVAIDMKNVCGQRLPGAVGVRVRRSGRSGAAAAARRLGW